MSGEPPEVESAFEALAGGRAEDALGLADEAIAANDAFAPAHEARALALTMLDRIAEADGAFRRAAELDPETYFVPFRLEGGEFDAAVEEALARLPARFREYLDNVEIGIEDVPTLEMIEEGLDFDLLGVYIGSTVGADDWDFPDRIALFQRNLENISPDRETLLAEIKDTLLHEVGHHFGMDEETLREIEDEK